MLSLIIPCTLVMSSRCALVWQCTFLIIWNRVSYISIRRQGWLPDACFKCYKLKRVTQKSRWVEGNGVLNKSYTMCQMNKCETNLSFYRWRLFRGSVSFACLTSSLYSTVCIAFALVGFSRFVCIYFLSFLSLKIYQHSCCTQGTFEKDGWYFKQSNFVTFLY